VKSNDPTLFAEIVNYLKSWDYATYRESKLPDRIDYRITEACEIFKAAEPVERVKFSAMLEEEAARQFLLEYAEQMSMQSVRARSPVLLINGLVALEMMPTRLDLDYGDYMALALLYHSATRLGNPEQLFGEAAQYAGDTGSKEFILHFTKRPSQHRKLEAFGYHEVMGPHGLVYQYDDHRIPDGLL